MDYSSQLNKTIVTSEDVFEFLHSKLQSNSFSAFHEMRRNGEQIDVIVQGFPAHRLVLSAAIPYFRTMFGSKMSESEMKDIPLEEIDAASLESLIDFAYTGRVKIMPENVQSLLKTCDFLQIEEVKEGCCQFLSKRLNSSNVVITKNLADSLNCQSLVESAKTYIRENFETFCLSREFLSLPFPFVKELIVNDDLHVTKEEIVFEAVVKWVKADSERIALLPELLCGVRMTLLTPEYLVKQVSNEKLIKSSISCRDLVDEAKNCSLLPNDVSVCRTFTTRKRSCNVRVQTTMAPSSAFAFGAPAPAMTFGFGHS